MLRSSNVIYGLHESGDSEIRYVGKTCDVVTRLNDHRHQNVKDWNHCFHDWLCSVRSRGALCMRVLQFGPADWRAAEVRWIERLRSEGHRLLNSAPGGDGREQGFVVSPLTRARISATMTGMSKSLEHRANISAAQKGRSFSLVTRGKLSAARTGRINSPETRSRLSLALRGKTRSPEHCAKLSAVRKGRRHSPETRMRMSDAQKVRWAK